MIEKFLAISETEHSLTESLDSVSELPNTVGQQLQHLVKSRPRRTKTRAPTRPMLRPDQPVDGLALGEGLDVFFRPTTPTTPLISPTSDDRYYTERNMISGFLIEIACINLLVFN